MTKYRKRFVFEAKQFKGDENLNELINWIDKNQLPCGDDFDLIMDTPEGVLKAKRNDWVVKDEKGVCYPCKPEIFEKTYELVND